MLAAFQGVIFSTDSKERKNEFLQFVSKLTQNQKKIPDLTY